MKARGHFNLLGGGQRSDQVLAIWTVHLGPALMRGSTYSKHIPNQPVPGQRLPDWRLPTSVYVCVSVCVHAARENEAQSGIYSLNLRMVNSGSINLNYGERLSFIFS